MQKWIHNILLTLQISLTFFFFFFTCSDQNNLMTLSLTSHIGQSRNLLALPLIHTGDSPFPHSQQPCLSSLLLPVVVAPSPSSFPYSFPVCRHLFTTQQSNWSFKMECFSLWSKLTDVPNLLYKNQRPRNCLESLHNLLQTHSLPLSLWLCKTCACWHCVVLPQLVVASG